MDLIQSSNKAAIQINDEVYSFNDLKLRVKDCQKKFFKQNDCCYVLKSSKTIDFIEKFLALWNMEVPIVIVSSHWTDKENSLRLQQIGSFYSFNEQNEIIFNQSNVRNPINNQTKVILFTSGSTSIPQGVQLSKKNIHANIAAVIKALNFNTVNEQLLFLSLSYSFGLFGQLLPGLVCQLKTKLLNSLVELKIQFDEGLAHGMISGVPSHFETLIQMLAGSEPCLSISHIASAGAYLNPQQRIRINKLFPKAIIYNNYGQTEASPRILCFNSTHESFYTEATGYVVGNLQTKIDKDNVLLVKGDQIMLGYLNDEIQTKKKIRNGWLYTGDVAKIEKDGLITIIGRNDDMIKIGGERIFPSEIEDEIVAISEIVEAGIIPIQDTLYGNAIQCAIVLKNDANLSLKDLKEKLSLSLSKNKIPSAFFKVKSLPKNNNGKLLRKEIPELIKFGERID